VTTILGLALLSIEVLAILAMGAGALSALRAERHR
jgi:hypothetical protein